MPRIESLDFHRTESVKFNLPAFPQAIFTLTPGIKLGTSTLGVRLTQLNGILDALPWLAFPQLWPAQLGWEEGGHADTATLPPTHAEHILQGLVVRK